MKFYSNLMFPILTEHLFKITIPIIKPISIRGEMKNSWLKKIQKRKSIAEMTLFLLGFTNSTLDLIVLMSLSSSSFLRRPNSITPLQDCFILNPLKTTFGWFHKLQPIVHKLKKPRGKCLNMPVEISQPAMNASPFWLVSHSNNRCSTSCM